MGEAPTCSRVWTRLSGQQSQWSQQQQQQQRQRSGTVVSPFPPPPLSLSLSLSLLTSAGFLYARARVSAPLPRFRFFLARDCVAKFALLISMKTSRSSLASDSPSRFLLFFQENRQTCRRRRTLTRFYSLSPVFARDKEGTSRSPPSLLAIFIGVYSDSRRIRVAKKAIRPRGACRPRSRPTGFLLPPFRESTR